MKMTNVIQVVRRREVVSVLSNDLVTIKVAAELMGVTMSQVSRWMDAGMLPVYMPENTPASAARPTRLTSKQACNKLTNLSAGRARGSGILEALNHFTANHGVAIVAASGN